MDALGLGAQGIILGMSRVVYSGYVAGQTAATVSVDWDIGVLCSAGHWRYAYIGSPILFIAGSTIRVHIVPLSGDGTGVDTERLVFSASSNKRSFTIESSLSTEGSDIPSASFYLVKYD